MTTASVNDRIQLIVNGASKEETCSPSLAKVPWEFDKGAPAYGPGASMGDVIPTGSPVQGGLPEEYKVASNEELHARIRAAKATLGDKLVILGHFYQRDEVVQHADYLGDSFQLARAAADRGDGRRRQPLQRYDDLSLGPDHRFPQAALHADQTDRHRLLARQCAARVDPRQAARADGAVAISVAVDP